MVARVSMLVEDRTGRSAMGWGETPLSVQWGWPSTLPYGKRQAAFESFCRTLVQAWAAFDRWGHPIEIGHDFLEHRLPDLLLRMNEGATEEMPWLAALICCSAFDIALHDAYGMLHQTPVYETYNADFMNADLAQFIVPASRAVFSFEGRYPAHYLRQHPQQRLPVWHLVGGLDPLAEDELDGHAPQDGYPVLLRDWIQKDGLKCLKIKLRGNDAAWDYERILRVGTMAMEEGVDWLSTDFNCTVTDPAYVNDMLDRLLKEQPRIYGMILYVEQPFPYDLERDHIDVHSVAARKPLFMDESAHDWRAALLGRELGWSGVALKTCKTQSSALLSLAWARAHGMTLMVQDLTNPMLAQIPHVLLAAHAETIMGVESNGMQFYPAASAPEAQVHPGLYQRRDGLLDLSTVKGPGFGYNVSSINRRLPKPVLSST
ncbi:MAG: mandelate racemase/muconate lactonizing enzyme family protein [Candidatus Hydrogenedentes bacterium]|nr:mandelate racemase/muconate lactonizing enzyme family protein [Candidatus Hydrogenedentota bacterium]MBI3118657.1 mandelate racemase/muconate lactonizing enzyme family protein [Candidatus Hydrogenedentota bacterium]